MNPECAIPHCPLTARVYSLCQKNWFCSRICEAHARQCQDYFDLHCPSPPLGATGAPADVEFLGLATVGNGVTLASSTIMFADTGKSIGLGLFAAREFQPRESITQYYGRVLKDTVLKDDLEHAIEIGGGWTINGTQTATGEPLVDPARQLMSLRAGGAAYANDLDYPRVAGLRPDSVRAPLGARTNAIFRRVMDLETKVRLDRGESIDKEDVAIILEATEFIPSGAEIFVSYSLVAYVTVAPPRQAASKRKQSAPKRRAASPPP